MHISETTVKRPVLAAVLSLFVVLIGIASYDKLTIREYPDIDRPVVTVTTVYKGASSKILERDVTQIIEDSLAGISGIREITSESKDEVSKIRVEFTLQTKIDSAANDVRDKVSRVAALLPDQADSPRIAKSDSDARAMMWIGFSSDILTSIQLNDLSGNPVEAESLNGIKLVNVWASWCITCLVEHPFLTKLSNNDIEIIGLNYKDTDAKANAWLEKHGNPYLFSMYDPRGDLAFDLGVSAFSIKLRSIR